MLCDDITLLDIRHASCFTLVFMKNMSETEFLADTKTPAAVLHQLMVIDAADKPQRNSGRRLIIAVGQINEK